MQTSLLPKHPSNKERGESWFCRLFRGGSRIFKFIFTLKRDWNRYGLWTFQRGCCKPLNPLAQSIPSHPWFLEGPEAWKWVWKMAWFGLKQSDLEPERTPHQESVQEETLPSESPDPPHLFWGAWINQHFSLVGWQSEMTWLWFQRVRRRGFITYNRILD